MLVADDKANIRQLLSSAFSEQGFDVTTASNGDKAVALLESGGFHVVITDLNMPGRDGIDVLRAAKSANPDTEVLIITAFGNIETAVEAMRLGACDFITKPFRLAEIENKIKKLLRGAPKPTEQSRAPGYIVGNSEATQQLKRRIAKIAPAKSAVLITGDTGVGKERVARAIHAASPRRDKPFIAINCAALAVGVLESELFGHEKGAFTGAVRDRAGRFERAHQGTLFLDEVAEIEPPVQAKLLRVLQESEFERVGGNTTIPVDVRVLAATNRDIDRAIKEGRFREDFFYRLNVFSLKVPPLRERLDDLPMLIDHFLHKSSDELDKRVTRLDDEVMELFLRYPWPGNIRELENVIEHAVVLAEGDSVTCGDLPGELTAPPKSAPLPTANETAVPGGGNSLTERTGEMERDIILGALEKFRWNKTKAAEHLGLKRTTLQYKIKKLELE